MARTWKEVVRARVPPGLAREIETFENQTELRRQGKVDDKVYAETRLRRGVYGQRYDNGQRHDGVEARALLYPRERSTKGPDTLWDAPGMQRIKIPGGGLCPEQMELLADVSEEYSSGILHVTTRQDFQIHYVHIDDTPDLMWRLAAVNITTREACGNVVRNVTCCPIAGVCREEAFDVTPYAQALAYFLLGHPDAQDFGRKFKPSFSGCEHHACGLVTMHDLGFIAKTQQTNGVIRRGFDVYVGGGLGAVPHQAKLLEAFVPEEQILPLSQAVGRVFARYGEKNNRGKARIKFLLAKLGIEEFRRLVREERLTLPPDDRWTAYLDELRGEGESPVERLAAPDDRPPAKGFETWRATNVYRQRQGGYATVTVNLPLGDISAEQMRRLAYLARAYVGDNVRTTVEQNIVLRWVPEESLPALHAELAVIGLADPGAGTIVDITACPGTDTCKLGIASSRGLAAELRTRLAAKSASLPDAIKSLKIKISGCFNSCGQHHVADIGFYGSSRKAGRHLVPHFQVILGGRSTENAGSYGLAMGAVPSKAIPAVVDAVTDHYAAHRGRGETFQQFIARLGRKKVRALIEPFLDVPTYEADPSFYSDWGDPREFTLGDLGVGECAGEVVSRFSLEVSKAESEAFEAQVALEQEQFNRAARLAYRAMLLAARALVLPQFQDVGTDPDRIVEEFRKRFYDSRLFFDRFAGGKFAHYLFARHRTRGKEPDGDAARRAVEQAQLFIEASHACDARMSASTPESADVIAKGARR